MIMIMVMVYDFGKEYTVRTHGEANLESGPGGEL
jgi:hypothetical protein